MKRIFLILAFTIGLFSCTKSQIENGNLDPSFRTYVTRCIAASTQTPLGPSYSALNHLYKNLRADVNLAKLDYCKFYAQDFITNSLLDLSNSSYNASFNGGISWVANSGWTSNGTTGYINSNYNPATTGVNYTLNSGCFGFYLTTSTGDGAAPMGCQTPSFIIGNPLNGGLVYGLVNTATAPSVSSDDNSTKGLFSFVRTNATTIQIWHNGIMLASIADNSTAIPSYNIYELCRNTAGVASLFSTNTIAFSFVGSGTIDQLALYKSVQIAMRTVGLGSTVNKPVYTTYFLGDSYTFGQGATTQDSCWANMVWQTKSLEGQNNGQDGYAITQGSSAPCASFDLSTIPLKGRYNKGIVSSWGINDANITCFPSHTVSTFTTAYNNFFNQCVTNGYGYSELKVVSYLLPTFATIDTALYYNSVSAMKTLCSSLGVQYIDCKAYMKSHGGDALFHNGGGDNGHPTNAGYKVIRDYVLSQL